MNKAFVVGNVGKIFPGNNFIKFSVATNSTWKDKDGQPQKKTEWHSIFVPGKYSESLTKVLKVGQRVAIDGSIQYDSQEKDGVKKYYTSIVANSVEIVDWNDGKESTTAAPSEDGIPF
jgi:single-strand DNA-binding protein